MYVISVNLTQHAARTAKPETAQVPLQLPGKSCQPLAAALGVKVLSMPCAVCRTVGGCLLPVQGHTVDVDTALVSTSEVEDYHMILLLGIGE